MLYVGEFMHGSLIQSKCIKLQKKKLVWKLRWVRVIYRLIYAWFTDSVKMHQNTEKKLAWKLRWVHFIYRWIYVQYLYKIYYSTRTNLFLCWEGIYQNQAPLNHKKSPSVWRGSVYIECGYLLSREKRLNTIMNSSVTTSNGISKFI